MSFVGAVPEFIGTSARDLVGIGMTISNSNAIAAGPTVALSAAAGDQVSAAVAAFFSGHARGYQTLSAQAAEIHDEFVQKLGSGANNYAAAEAANAAPMDSALVATNTADKAATGPQTAGGADATPTSGANGPLRGSGGGSAGAQQRAGSSGGRLAMGMIGASSPTRVGESSGNERFGGLLFGNNGGAGSATRLGTTPAAEAGRLGGLLGTTSRTDNAGAARQGAILLRPVDSGADSATVSTASQAGGGKVPFGDHRGWLFSSRCVGGSGGQLRFYAGSAEAGPLGVSSGAGANGGLSMARPCRRVVAL